MKKKKDIGKLLNKHVSKPTITKKSLKTVNNIDTLNSWMKKNSGNSKKKELIVARIVEVLSKISDINVLKALYGKYWHSDPVSEFIEMRIIEVLKAILPAIYDKQFFKDWMHISFWKSETRELLEARLIEIFKEILPEIFDINEIVDWWDKGQSGTNAGYELLRHRTIEVLNTINDMDVLFSALEKVYLNGWLEGQIDNRMEHVLRNILPKISDINTLIVWDKNICSYYDGKVVDVAAHNCILWQMEELLRKVFDAILLISYWKKSCCCKSPIEYQFKEALNKIFDVKELVEIRKKIPSDAYALIKCIDLRMGEVVKEKLPKISNMNKLLNLYGKDLGSREAYTSIRDKIFKMIDKITVNNVPKWFVVILEQESVPEFFSKKIKLDEDSEIVRMFSKKIQQKIEELNLS